MKVSIVYAGAQPLVLRCVLEEGVSVKQALDQSGILNFCPDIDLKTQKIGVYGKLVKHDSLLKEGDRIEIYRRITRVPDEDDDED